MAVGGTNLTADGLLAEDMPVKLIAAADQDDQGRASLIQDNVVYIFESPLQPGMPFPAVLATFSRGQDNLYHLDRQHQLCGSGGEPHRELAPHAHPAAHHARTFTGDMTQFEMLHNRTHVSARTLRDTTGVAGKACFCDACACSTTKKTPRSGAHRDATTRPLQVVGCDWLGRRHKKAVTPEGYCTGLLFCCEHTNYGFFVPSTSKTSAAATDAFKQCRAHGGTRRGRRLVHRVLVL